MTRPELNGDRHGFRCGNRDAWTDIMRHTIAMNASFFNTHRMVLQYVLNAYLETACRRRLRRSRTPEGNNAGPSIYCAGLAGLLPPELGLGHLARGLRQVPKIAQGRDLNDLVAAVNQKHRAGLGLSVGSPCDAVLVA